MVAIGIQAVKERVGSEPLTRERPGGERATATLSKYIPEPLP